jgi:hypothetical protein
VQRVQTHPSTLQKQLPMSVVPGAEDEPRGHSLQLIAPPGE